jgi:hypothetical protein
LKNNLVSAPFYYVLIIVEYLELIFLYLVFAFLFFQKVTYHGPNSTTYTIVEQVEGKITSTIDYMKTD